MKVLEVTSNKEKAIVSIVKFTVATFSDQAALIVLQKFHPNSIRRFVIMEKAPTRAFS